MKNKISTADNIRILRENLGFSQDYVATKLDITQQAYSSIEKNPEKATLKRIKEIANVLQVSFVTLLGEDETYIQQNFYQQGGNTAQQMSIKSTEKTFETLEKMISEQKEEILFLRGLVKK